MYRRSPLALGLLFTAFVAPVGAQAGPEETDFFVTWGLRQVEHALGEDGRELTLYRPDGGLSSLLELALLADADGSFTSAVLRVDRALFDDDREVARELVASYLENAVPIDDEQQTAGLRGMIRSDDDDVRRGETERSGGCCALPPVPARDVAAVAVVDGLRAYALVRLDETSVRFREGETPAGVPALLITVSGPEPPEQVVEAVFDAARYRDDAWLFDLCGYGVETDGDVETLCTMTSGRDEWDAFVEAFRTGEVTGPAEIEGDRARVPFRFGPEGRRDEVMELANVAGRWVLLAF